MKLTGFRIQNFKSISDTGWKTLSDDKISALIGQNEAGKSAVLEALFCFDDRNLKEDYLRDDLFPVISCSFDISDSDTESLRNEFSNGDAIADYFVKTGEVTLTRTWSGITAELSTLTIDDNDALDIISVNGDPEPANKEPDPQPPTTPTPATPTPAAPVEAKSADSIVTVELLTEKLYGLTPNIEMFKDFDSLLPPKIDLADIDDEKSVVEGKKGAINYLNVIGLKSSELAQPQNRTIAKRIRTANKNLTTDFQKFWRQFIGRENKIEIEFELKNHDDTDTGLAGKPYICFWVKDGQELLHPAQRSRGVQWFLSFYLQLQASKRENQPNNILLIDEPAMFLHAKAQADVLKVLEDTKDNLQIIYTTHSPYLIDVKTLYRLIAVQRDDADDSSSDTRLFDIKELGAASRETLSPVYTTIGVSLEHQQVIKAKDNVILEEPSAFYYLSAFKHLLSEKHPMHFLPATGVTNVPLLVNLFLGWGLDFVVVTDDDRMGKQIRRGIKKDVYGGDATLAKNHLLGITGCDGVEDIFSVSDFKKYVLEGKDSYTESNSKYVLANNKPKLVLAIGFYKKVMGNKIKLTDLTKQTQKAITDTVAGIVTSLDSDT